MCSGFAYPTQKPDQAAPMGEEALGHACREHAYASVSITHQFSFDAATSEKSPAFPVKRKRYLK
jgi:hypothetical protein